MSSLLQELNLHWTADLSVGSALLDARNQRMFARLAQADAVLEMASVRDDQSQPRGMLVQWLGETLAQLDELLEEEERELAAAGYPELTFHRQLHALVRTRMQACRARLDAADGVLSLEETKGLVQESCAELAIWLMRHMQDADKLFSPYVDVRFRNAGP